MNKNNKNKPEVVVGDIDVNTYYVKSNSNIIYRNDGDVTICSVGKHTTLTFCNSGSVYIDCKKDYKHNKFIFRNKGTVMITYAEKLNGYYEFRNIGMVRLKNTIAVTQKCIFRNKGDVYTILPEIMSTVDISNYGDFSNPKAKRINPNTVFRNYGNLTLRGCEIVSQDVTFNNGGNVVLGDNKIFLGRNTEFNNKGNVYLRNATSIAMNSTFRNGGNVVITGLKELKRQTSSMIIENNGDFIFKDLEVLKSLRSNFNNNGNVVMKKLKTLTTDTKFYNNGHVFINKVKDIHRTHFYNGGNVYVNNIDYINGDTKYANGGNLYIKKLDSEYKKTRVVIGGYLYTKSGVYLNGASYIKRYGIQVDDGYIMLYKAVDSKYKAPYDSEQKTWDLYKTNTVSYWDPYKDEIKGGKFVASAVPYWSSSLMKNEKCKYVAIAVHINDIFEWKALPKYPKLIGFRTGTVLYECDALGNKIE